MKQREPGEPGRTAEEPGPGAPPPPVSELRVPGFHTTAQTLRPEPSGPNNGTPEHPQTL